MDTMDRISLEFLDFDIDTRLESRVFHLEYNIRRMLQLQFLKKAVTCGFHTKKKSYERILLTGKKKHHNL